MKTRRNSWTLAILATGLLLGYVGADLLELPPLHAGGNSSTAGGLPHENARDIAALRGDLQAVQNSLVSVELLVEPVRDYIRPTPSGLEIEGDLRIGGELVAGPDGGPELAVGPDEIRMSEGLTEATFDEDGLVLGTDTRRAVELLVHEDPLAIFNTRLVVHAEGPVTEAQSSFDATGFHTSVRLPGSEDPLAEQTLRPDGFKATVAGGLASTTLSVGEDDFNAIIQPMDSTAPLAQIGVDPIRAIIAVLHPVVPELSSELRVGEGEVKVQTSDFGVESEMTSINSEKGILACDTNMCVNHVYANTVEAYEFIEKSE